MPITAGVLKLLRAAAFVLLLIAACAQVEEPPDNAPAVSAPVCPQCPAVNCTKAHCSAETNYLCRYENITPCCGNSVCEEGEYSRCPDCTLCAQAVCKNATYDYEGQACIYTDIVPCCGNSICEEGEQGRCRDCPECTAQDKCMQAFFDTAAQACMEKPIIPCCGNSICDRGEDCSKCPADCRCADEALPEFPEFLDRVLIVVGDLATSQDSLTASFVSTNLYLEGAQPESAIYSMADADKLEEWDLIVLGRPCENFAWEKYMGVGCGTDNYFEENTALIKLTEEGGREIIFVGGSTPEDTRKAAEYLMSSGLLASEIELDTAGAAKPSG